jgi:ABC-type transport system involved in cytochrome bd biosynthesis fused ATPase/permease subunit
MVFPPSSALTKRGLARCAGCHHRIVHDEHSGQQGRAHSAVHAEAHSRCLSKTRVWLAFVDLVIAGRRYGLIGKNGVGKSTLLRNIAQFRVSCNECAAAVTLIASRSAD